MFHRRKSWLADAQMAPTYTFSLTEPKLRLLLSAPNCANVLSGRDLVIVVFSLSTWGRPKAPSRLTIDQVMEILRDSGFVCPLLPSELEEFLLEAAALGSPFAVAGGGKSIRCTDAGELTSELGRVCGRPEIQDIFGVPELERPPGIRRPGRLRPPPVMKAPEPRREGPLRLFHKEGGLWTLTIADTILRSLLVAPNSAEVLSGADLLTIIFRLEMWQRGVEELSLTIDEVLEALQTRGFDPKRTFLELADLLREAAETDPTFDLARGEGRLRPRSYLALEDRLGELCGRPEIQDIFGIPEQDRPPGIRRPERLPPHLKPPPKLPRAAPAKPPELPPPPPLVPAQVHFAPLTEADVTRAWSTTMAVRVRASGDPPKAASARASAERFALRNGIAEVKQVVTGIASYLVTSVAYRGEADETHEGILRIVIGDDSGEPDSGEIDEAVGVETGPAAPASTMASDAPAERLPALAPAWIAARSREMVERATQPFVREVVGRHARQYARVKARFVALAAAAPALSPEAPDAELARLAAARDEELAGLCSRFAVRITCSCVGLVWAELRAQLVRVELRRRKAERVITLRMPAGAHDVDKLRCEGCGALMTRPSACDEQMHLLCERCAPSTQGRIDCPVCGAAVRS
jgi:hypothetical protein